MSEDGYGVMFDANGVRLRMSVVRELNPAPFAILSWVVVDIRAMVKALGAKGVVFERYGFSSRMSWGFGLRRTGRRWHGLRMWMGIRYRSRNFRGRCGGVGNCVN